MKKLIIASLALTTIFAVADAGQAQSPQQYGVFRVYNNTSQPITYQVNWDRDGRNTFTGWATWTVQPGAINNHWIPWTPGTSFPKAIWTYYDFTRNAWSPVASPAASIGTDQMGGFRNNLGLLPNGSMYLGTSSD